MVQNPSCPRPGWHIDALTSLKSVMTKIHVQIKGSSILLSLNFQSCMQSSGRQEEPTNARSGLFVILKLQRGFHKGPNATERQ